MKNGRDGLHTKAQPAGCQSLGPVQPKCKGHGAEGESTPEKKGAAY